MFHYKLRTLMILLAIGPPLWAGVWWNWPKVAEINSQRTLSDIDKLVDLISTTIGPDSWDDVGGPGSIDSFSCILTVTFEDALDGPDPCGQFRPCAVPEDDVFSTLSGSPTISQSADDPFAPMN